MTLEDHVHRHADLFGEILVFGKSVFIGTMYPISFDSPDHMTPQGCVEDYTDGAAFAAQFMAAFPAARTALDLGCATGTVPLSYRFAGLEAYGIEGASAPNEQSLGAWSWFPGILATADISRPFALYHRDGSPFLFDIITAWGVLEHINPDRAGQVLTNINAHLSPAGVAVLAIDQGRNQWHQGVEARGDRAEWNQVLSENLHVDDPLRDSHTWVYPRPSLSERMRIPRRGVDGPPIYQGKSPMDGRFYVWARRKSQVETALVPKLQDVEEVGDEAKILAEK